MSLIRKYISQYISRSAWPNRPSLHGRSASPRLFLQNLVLGSYIIFILFSIFSPIGIGAAGALDNIGFIQRNIWYSQDPFYEGDTIDIYTIVSNSGQETVTGRVEFYDKNVILGEEDFIVEPGTFQDVSIQWNVTAGDHVISAQIIGAEVVTPEGGESTQLKYAKTDEDRKFIPKKITAIEDTKEKVEEIGEFIEEKTPDVVEETFRNITSGLDVWREKINSNIEEEIENTKAQLEEIKQVSETTTDQLSDSLTDQDVQSTTYDQKDKIPQKNKLETPFKYAKLWFLQLISFIFASKFIFYLLLVLIAFLFLRFIWKRMRRKSHY